MQGNIENVLKFGLEIIENHAISMKTGAKMGSEAHSGPEGSQGGKKVLKMVWIWSGLGSFWAPFWYLKAPFRESFLMLFREGSFSVFGRLLGARGAQKGSKMEPKRSPKRARGHPLGSVKTMAGAMFPAYKGVSGRVREATFSRLGLQTLFGEVLGCIFDDFRRFWDSLGLGSLWAPCGAKKAFKNQV